MDAVTCAMAAAVVVLAAVCYFIFKNVNQQPTFEQSYGTNALKLLKEEKTKAKPKANKNKKKDAKTTDKKDAKDKSDDSANAEKITPPEKSAAPIVAETSKKASTSKSNKTDIVSGAAKISATPEAPSSSKKEHVTKQESVDAKLSEAESQPFSDGANKKKKKNRGRKNDSDDAANGTVSEENIPKAEAKKTHASLEKQTEKESPAAKEAHEQTAKVLTTKVNEQVHAVAAEKKRQKRSSNTASHEVSLESLISHLASLEDIEPDYVAFLAKHAETLAKNDAKLHSNINTLESQCVERERQLNELKAQLKSLNAKDTEIQHVYATLKKEREQHETFEQSVRPKIAECVQLKEKVKQLEVALGNSQRSAQNVSQYQQLSREVEFLRNELENAKKIAEDRQINDVSKKQLEAELFSTTNAFQASKKLFEDKTRLMRTELDAAKKNEEHRLSELHNAEKELKALREEVERVQSNYRNVIFEQKNAQNSGDQEKLNSELARVSGELSNWQSRVSELDDKHKSELTQHELKKKEWEEEKAQLARNLDISTKKLADFEAHHKEHSGDAKKLKEALAKNAELEKELSAHKADGNAAAAQATETERLAKQLEEQTQKNQELRERNYKIMDAMQTLEQTTTKMLKGVETKHDDSLKEISAASQKCLLAATPNGTKLPRLEGALSLESYLTWLNECANALKSAESQTPAAAPVAAASAPQPTPQPNERKTAVLEAQVQRYKAALAQVMVQMDAVAKEAARVDDVRRTKIAELERSIEQIRSDAK